MEIKILKSSIRRNPSFGNGGMRTFMNGPTECDVTYKGPIPKYLKNKIVEYQWHYPLNKPIETRFLVNGNPPKRLFNDKNASITVRNEYIETTCKSDGEGYLYRYQNPALECGECGEKTKLKDIEEDYDYNNNKYTICGHCGTHNTFPYLKYEKIEDALKTLIYGS